MFFVSLRRSVIELGVDPAGSVSIIPGASQCDSAHNGGLWLYPWRSGKWMRGVGRWWGVHPYLRGWCPHSIAVVQSHNTIRCGYR